MALKWFPFLTLHAKYGLHYMQHRHMEQSWLVFITLDNSFCSQQTAFHNENLKCN